VGEIFTSGNWVVQAGKEDEFIKAWTDFTSWTRENASGAEEFLLIRETPDGRHFLSLGSWESFDAVRQWRSTDEFQQKLGACRALCDDFRAGDYELAASARD
jgi:heme-degrading monooxygenase HmoA